MLFAEPATKQAQDSYARVFRCTYEEWDQESGAMKQCGEPGYGYMSRPGNALCKAHFAYARGTLGRKGETTKYNVPIAGWSAHAPEGRRT